MVHFVDGEVSRARRAIARKPLPVGRDRDVASGAAGSRFEPGCAAISRFANVDRRKAEVGKINRIFAGRVGREWKYLLVAAGQGRFVRDRIYGPTKGQTFVARFPNEGIARRGRVNAVM